MGRWMLLGMALSACTVPEPAADQVMADFTWRPGTVVLEEGLLLGPSGVVPDALAGQTTWTWAEAPPELMGLMPQDVVVSPDLGLVRVLAIDDAGPDWVLTTEEAALTDAVEQAHLVWDIGVVPQRIDAGQALLLRSSGTAREWQGTIGQFEVAYQITPEGEDFKGKLSAKYTQGVADLRLSTEALVKGFRQQGEVVVDNGVLEVVDLTFDPIGLDGTIDVGGVEGVAGQVTFQIPLKITWPFALGPLPAFVGLGAAMEVDVRLNPDSGTNQRAHFEVLGSARVLKTQAGWDTSGKVDRFVLELQDASDVSVSGHGIGTLAKFPIVELGIGVAGRVETTLFTELHTEVVNNFSIISQGGFIVGNCRKVDLGLQHKVGGRIQAFLFQIQDTQTTFTKTSQTIKEARPGDCALVP